MFERFTDRARRVVVFAQEEAHLLDHNYIGTEHILMGLLHERESIACIALNSFGITLRIARQRAEAISGRGKTAVRDQQIPFTSRAKRVLELSLREALALSHNYIGTEHILLGLLHEGNGVGTKIILGSGDDLQEIRGHTFQLIRSSQGHGPAAADAPPARIPAATGVRVFISYRRQEASHVAGRISDWLDNHLDDGQVFMDVDSIELGVDFTKAINNAVGQCDVLLAIIGPNWATTTDNQNRSRLSLPNDLVRLEIEAALKRDVRVVPVLVDNAEMPSADDLPQPLRTLAYRNGIKIRHDSFRQDVTRLTEAVRTIVKSNQN